MESTASSRDYEFSPSDESVIGGTARWVGIWAWFAMVGGAITAAGSLLTLPDGVEGLAFGTVYLIIGIYFRGAGRSLKSVVETEGNDVHHLLSALGSLQSAFKVMVIVAAIGIILGSLAAIVAGM